MLGSNPTDLAVYIKIKRATELCRPTEGDWLMKASSVWRVVGERGDRGSLYPNYTRSLDGEKEGKVSGNDLPRQ